MHAYLFRRSKWLFDLDCNFSVLNRGRSSDNYDCIDFCFEACRVLLDYYDWKWESIYNEIEKNKKWKKKRKHQNWFQSVLRIVQFSSSMWGRTWCFARGVLFFFVCSLSLVRYNIRLPFHVSFPFRSFLLYSCRQAWSSVVLLPRFTAIGIVAIAVLTDLGYVVSEILERFRHVASHRFASYCVEYNCRPHFITMLIITILSRNQFLRQINLHVQNYKTVPSKQNFCFALVAASS